MGTFEKAYEVDGEQYELYLQSDEPQTFQLVDTESLPVGGLFSEIPAQETVIELVRSTRPASESAA